MTDRRGRPSESQIAEARARESVLSANHGAGDPFAAAVRSTRMAMTITDPRQNDNPIIFANEAFSRLSGYHHDELIGRNCRILQGPETSRKTVQKLARAIERHEDVHVEILNYRKDGTAFWNSLYVSPVRDEKGEVVFFFGSQLDVSEKKQTELDLNSVNDELRETRSLLEQQIDDRTGELMRLLAQRSRLVNELDHRVKNNLQIIGSLLAFELRRDLGAEARELVTRFQERVDALGLAHRDQHNKDAIGYFGVDTFIRTLVGKILVQQHVWHREPHYDLEAVSLPIGKAAPLSLALNEFVRVLLSTDDHQRTSEPARLSVSARRRNEMLSITVSSASLTWNTCRLALENVEDWTMKLLERQLDAHIELIEDSKNCGMHISLPLNGTTHDARQ